MKYGTRKLIAFLVLVTPVACTGRSSLDAEDTRELLPFVRNGKVTKNEIRVRLGEPYREYEKGRILTYWLRYKDARLSNIERGSSWNTGEPHILVLVFGPDDVLEQHSVVIKH